MKESSSSTRLLPYEAGYSTLGDLVKQHQKTGGKVFILSDETVYRNCMPRLLQFLPELETASVMEVEPGEKAKDIEIVHQLWHELTESGASRNDLFICLGGGMICDLGGFTASVFKRGLRTFYIPTTLLAQADAAIGGKTAVNFRGVKNLLGTFHMPELVILDQAYLETLPHRELLAGMAEIVKLGLAADRDLWESIYRGDGSDPEKFSTIVTRAANLKREICTRDFRDQNERKKLNFGHTIGHALESLSLGSDHPLIHGEAVAAGMICEAWISFRKGLLDEGSLQIITAFLSERFPEGETHFPPEQFLGLISQDKKSIQGEIRFVLLTGPGSSICDQPVEEPMIMASLEYYRSAYARV